MRQCFMILVAVLAVLFSSAQVYSHHVEDNADGTLARVSVDATVAEPMDQDAVAFGSYAYTAKGNHAGVVKVIGEQTFSVNKLLVGKVYVGGVLKKTANKYIYADTDMPFASNALNWVSIDPAGEVIYETSTVFAARTDGFVDPTPSITDTHTLTIIIY